MYIHKTLVLVRASDGVSHTIYIVSSGVGTQRGYLCRVSSLGPTCNYL